MVDKTMVQHLVYFLDALHASARLLRFYRDDDFVTMAFSSRLGGFGIVSLEAIDNPS